MLELAARPRAFLITLLGAAGALSVSAAEQVPIERNVNFTGSSSGHFDLTAGQVIELSVGIVEPSQLPSNGRVVAEWTGPSPDIGLRKVLHALDPDMTFVYRAPQAGRYTMSLVALERGSLPVSSMRNQSSPESP